jgi:hypothetical protein
MTLSSDVYARILNAHSLITTLFLLILLTSSNIRNTHNNTLNYPSLLKVFFRHKIIRYLQVVLSSIIKILSTYPTWLFLHVTKINDTLTFCRAPLDEWSAHGKELYVTTQDIDKTHIHSNGGNRTRNSSKQVATGPGLRPLGHWDRRL